MKGNEKETYRAHAKQTTKLTGERANDAILLKQSRSLGPLDAFFVDTSEVPEWNFERKRARSKKKARRTHLKEARRVSSIAQPCFAHSISYNGAILSSVTAAITATFAAWQKRKPVT
jgi:hypothetical protein